MSTASEIDMKIDPARAKSLVGALQSVEARIANVAAGRQVGQLTFPSLLDPSYFTLLYTPLLHPC
jgi:hypothetical protein